MNTHPSESRRAASLLLDPIAQRGASDGFLQMAGLLVQLLQGSQLIDVAQLGAAHRIAHTRNVVEIDGAGVLHIPTLREFHQFDIETL